MVEVTTGSDLDANAVAQLIASAAKSHEPLPPNPEADARLASLVAAVGTPPAWAPMQEYVPLPRAKPFIVPHPLPTTITVDRSVPVPHPKPGAVLAPAPVLVEKSAAPKATSADLTPAVSAPVTLAAKS
jgi:hypothetical protein